VAVLSIQLEGKWVQTDDESLVALMLGGQAGELTPARDPARSVSAGPLIELLGPSQLEVLTRGIVQRLPGLYVTGPGSTDLMMLLERIRGLRAWNWADPLTGGRLTWLEGWLSELAGGLERAVQCYDAYLRGLSQEPIPRLVAYNNRGVLRILLRQAEGVRDIARAAIPSEENGGSAGASRLPAASFNLLNLLTHALNHHPLRDQVEDVLVDFMAGLPKPAREHCLGLDPSDLEAWGGTRSDSGAAQGRAESEGSDRPAPDRGQHGRSEDDGIREQLRKRMRILTDPTFVRLTHLIVFLSDDASGVSPSPDGKCTLEAVASQLRLWTAQPTTNGQNGQPTASAGQRRRRSQLDAYAEAASLLYTSDIPASLVPGDGTVSWVRQYADKAINLVEEYCLNGQYRLAENTLASLADAIEKSRGDPHIDPVLDEMSQRLAEVRRRARAHEQLTLYQACTNLVGQVKEFCDQSDLCQAESQARILFDRIKQAQEQVVGEDVSDEEARALLNDLPERIRAHLDKLTRRDIEQRIGRWREQLQETCPRDWRQPVPEQAYEALRKCHVNDPHGLVEDWRAWRLRLDKHQARYQFRQALADVTDGKAGEETREMLARAFSLDPGLTPASSPLYCMLALQKLENPPEGFGQTKADILKVARELLQTEPLGAESLWSPAVRTGLVEEACVLVERLIQAYRGVGAELDELWQTLEQSLVPAFSEAPPQVLREILTVVDACLKASPAHSFGKGSGIDPRNRLYVLRQTCNRVILVAEGEEALHEGRPLDARGRLREAIEAVAEEGSVSDQDLHLLRRAACGLYLAVFGKQDPLHRQQGVLDQIDRWVDQVQRGSRDVDCGMERIETIIAEARDQAGV